MVPNLQAELAHMYAVMKEHPPKREPQQPSQKAKP
jgi:hypothetical protein